MPEGEIAHIEQSRHVLWQGDARPEQNPAQRKPDTTTKQNRAKRKPDTKSEQHLVNRKSAANSVQNRAMRKPVANAEHNLVKKRLADASAEQKPALAEANVVRQPPSHEPTNSENEPGQSEQHDTIANTFADVPLPSGPPLVQACKVQVRR